MEVSSASLQVIADLLAEHTGQQLTECRRWRVATALSRVFRERGISNVDQLACLLAGPEDPGLVQDVVEALLNNETYFFRDKPTFDQLPLEIFPQLAERRSHRRRLQIWCAGCSTGQEVHSLAIQFAEQARRWDGWSIDILGTDISGQVIKTARSGHYSQFEVQRGLSVQQMLAHFDETAAGWQMRSETRSVVRFERHNVLDRSPGKQPFDLILCRNLLLYFDPETRRRAFARLREALAPDGFLMLGAGETVVGQTNLFAPRPGLASIYAPAGNGATAPLALAS
ncbi:MAG TPA: protein-glutamate O-methyltransferase CheR [Erythrobacter sp.]|nr:protein-glutamate O-methyltransferase CheR [Erythrobacter sp.]